MQAELEVIGKELGVRREGMGIETFHKRGCESKILLQPCFLKGKVGFSCCPWGV